MALKAHAMMEITVAELQTFLLAALAEFCAAFFVVSLNRLCSLHTYFQSEVGHY